MLDSGKPSVPEDPGSGACGPPGQSTWCAGDLADARPNEAWKSFRTWSQPALAFATPPQTVTAGTPSAAMSLALVTSTGAPTPATTPLAVTVGSSSTSGSFSTSPAGPWTPTLGLTMPAGASTIGSFYTLDTRAGGHVLTASAQGVTSAMQPLVVSPGPAARVAVTPTTGAVRARGSRPLSATATDAFGNPAAASFRWRVIPAALGSVRPAATGTATFTARRALGRGRVLVLADTPQGTLSAEASVTVAPARLRIEPLSLRRTTTGLRVTVTAIDGARRPVSSAVVALSVTTDGRRRTTRRVSTGPSGRAPVLLAAAPRTCTTVRIVRASAAGFTWDGRERRGRVCR